MTWFRVDDSFPTHPKVLRIPRRERAAAIGLWTLAGSWCASQLTDGSLDEGMVEELAGSHRSADLLVSVGLWEKTDTGYRFHDFLDYNPSAEEVRADQARKHEAKAKAGRLGGIASGVARRKHEPSTDEADAKQDRSTDEAPAEADTKQKGSTDAKQTTPLLKQNEAPTRPDPVLASKEASSTRAPARTTDRGTRVPEPFVITDELWEWAHGQGFADRFVTSTTEAFVDFWRGKAGRDGVKVDWPATWRNWLRSEAKRRFPATAVAATGKPSWEL